MKVFLQECTLMDSHLGLSVFAQNWVINSGNRDNSCCDPLKYILRKTGFRFKIIHYSNHQSY